MSLDNLVLASFSGIANLCDEVLHGDSSGHTKEDRQYALQYVHALKDMLQAEKSGGSVQITRNFRELVGYFSNYFIEYEVERRKNVKNLCNFVSVTCLVGGASGMLFTNPDNAVSKAGYFVMGAGFGGFLLTEFFRVVVEGIIRNKEMDVRNDFEQILNSNDEVWKNAISRIRWDPKRYLTNAMWYAR